MVSEYGRITGKLPLYIAISDDDVSDNCLCFAWNFKYYRCPILSRRLFLLIGVYHKYTRQRITSQAMRAEIAVIAKAALRATFAYRTAERNSLLISSTTLSIAVFMHSAVRTRMPITSKIACSVWGMGATKVKNPEMKFASMHWRILVSVLQTCTNPFNDHTHLFLKFSIFLVMKCICFLDYASWFFALIANWFQWTKLFFICC